MKDDGADNGSAQTNSFDGGADAYARARPSYPPQAVDWLIPRTAVRVVDLGAGTGKFSALIAARGHDLVSIEPSASMRLEYRRAIPDADVRKGTFENIPLDDDSTEVAVTAQAWHWADPIPASLEVARSDLLRSQVIDLGSSPEQQLLDSVARRVGRLRAVSTRRSRSRISERASARLTWCHQERGRLASWARVRLVLA